MGFPQENRVHRRLRLLGCSSGVDVSSSAPRFLAARVGEHRRIVGTRWRRLNAGREALLTLAHLRNGQPYARLGAGFGIGTTNGPPDTSPRPSTCPRPRPRRGRTSGVDEGVRDPGQDAYTHRPSRRRPPVPLGQTQEALVNRALPASTVHRDLATSSRVSGRGVGFVGTDPESRGHVARGGVRYVFLISEDLG